MPTTLRHPAAVPAARERAVLTQAVLRAAELLAVSQADLAAIVGLSPASISRMKTGAYLLERGTKEWELAALWVRLFRSLDSITGGRDDLSRNWLTAHNAAFEARPLDLIRTITGLVRVVEYLDASRARI